MRAKLIAIHLLDIADDIIFRHRWYWFCNKVAKSSWWGNKDTFDYKKNTKKDTISILSEEGYKASLIELHNLWSAKEGTPEYDRFESLLDAVEVYEKAHFAIKQSGTENK
jgi:hypothetical protein